MSNYDNSFFARTMRLIARILNGTLIERIKSNREYVKDKHWNYFQASNDDFIVGDLPLGARIKLYKNNKLSKSIFFELFEQSELKFIVRFLRKGDIFLDIGANIGLFSLIAGKAVQSTGRVYAFEPARNTYEKLKENVTLNSNSNIYTHNVALSNSNATAEMFVSYNGYDAWNSLGTPKEGDGYATEIINTITLDSFAENEKLNRVDLIKIDVEGWEVPLLEGAKEVLTNKRYSPILMIEFTDECARNAGFTCKQLYNELLKLGYELYEYDEIVNNVVKHQPQEYYHYSNLIAAKDINQLMNRLKLSD